MIFRCLPALLVALAVSVSAVGAAPAREFYRDPAWAPRLHPTLEDVLSGSFHPAPPPLPAPVRYDTPGYRGDRLVAPPAAGVHPRVLITPEDVAALRSRVAQGTAAPVEFRTLWERVSASRSPLYALISGDDTLGRSLAAQFMRKVRALEPKLDRLDAQPDAFHLWSAERSLVASGDPDPPHELWTLLDYDYLHGWLSPADRVVVERIVARLVRGRVTNFLVEPDHFMINNHKGFGMEFIRLMLLIEGSPEFPAETYRLSVHKARAMLDWFLSPDGMCYESIKGWLNTSAFVAIGRRDPQFLRHDHLAAKLRFFQSALRWEAGAWRIRDEMRASAFHVIWLMRFLYPENLSHDLLYAATLTSHDFLTDARARWPDPVGVAPELLLLFAGGGPGHDRAGRLADWTSQAAIDALRLPLTWKDDLRGYVEARNSWRIGDLHLGFVNKQDFFYGGHEGSEANRLTLWKDGKNWIRDEDLLAVKATGLQNMLTVDGRGLTWPPVPGVWLGVNESPLGLTAAGDARLAYSYGKVMQVHSLASPSGRLPYYAPFTERNFDLTRDLQVAFHPGTVAFNDGYAHTDYGPWSGETRLVEHYRVNNPMSQAFRTVHLARGAHPYVLVIDDARKPDDRPHLFEASFNLPDDVVVVDAKTTEVRFQEVEPSDRRESEFLLAPGGTPRDPRTGAPVLRRGDPLLLLRVLHRASDYGHPIPRIQVVPGRPERPFARFSQWVVPAIGRSPEFRILLYPHRHGDPVPVTRWNDERTTLTVAFGETRDVYRFGRAAGGRTVFEFARNDAVVLANPAAPAAPVLLVHGDRFDPAEARTTRREGRAPLYPFAGEVTVAFERPQAPARVYYTLDGSEPGAVSFVYAAPFVVRASATLRARVIDPGWPGNRREGDVTAARFESRALPNGLASKPDGSASGLLARVYELRTNMWDDRGFFRASLAMLPDLDRATPLVTAAGRAGFVLPHAVPARPIAEQTKGFYRFSGWFRAEGSGLHTFAVESCGPVLLTVGGQDAITETGVFHQQHDERRGSVVLAEGWHPIDLVVTDPLFWNIATLDRMPFAVRVRDPRGDAFETVPAGRLAALFPADAAAAEPELVTLQASTPPDPLEPGVIRSAYDREGRTRDPDYLDVDGLTPWRVGPADRLEANTNPAQVVCYDGWFHAPVGGVYRFDLPRRRVENSNLGEFRSAYQSQLRISDTIVLQRGVAGRVTSGLVRLAAGWHPLSLRLGSSPATLTVVHPDGQRMSLEAAELRRSSHVVVREAGIIARPDFSRREVRPGLVALDPRCRVWLADFARMERVDGHDALVSEADASAAGPGAVDINLTRGVARVPLKLLGLKMLDPEFTVGGWFRSDSGSGVLFGKQGLTAFGKSYRTVSVRLDAGRLVAAPGNLRGGVLRKGTWHHVVLTATPGRLALYLDGRLVQSGPGAPGLATDALDFLPDHPGALAGLAIYNRELTEEEVARWHASGP
jgi:hypothetical protein